MIEFSHANGCNVISLEVPGKLECRDMVLRTVSSACKLVMPDKGARASRCSEITAHLVSAVGEAYNNIVLHGYAGRKTGSVKMQIENCSEWTRVVLMDSGTSFDPAQAVPPDLDALPESGLGVFIIRSFVDEVTYVAGPPNVLTLFKRLDGGDGSCINGIGAAAAKAS
jgi:serine/threonine-protein kinase RsbW